MNNDKITAKRVTLHFDNVKYQKFSNNVVKLLNKHTELSLNDLLVMSKVKHSEFCLYYTLMSNDGIVFMYKDMVRLV